MRIDLVITELFVGGAERCLTEVALALHRSGERVRVASIAPLPSGDRAQLVERLRGAGIEIFSTGCSRSWQVISAHRSLRRWLAADRPDVVQTMLYHANVLGTHAARSAQVQRCVGGLRVAEPNRLRLAVERHAVRQMDAVVCVSGSVRRFAEQAFGPAMRSSTVIPNAIDTAMLDAVPPLSWQTFGWPADAKVLLYVGRLHPQKGLDVLAQALVPLLAKHHQMRCLIVGDGPQRTMMQQLAERLGPDRLQVTLWRSDVLAIIKACRIVVLPSRYEGMPNVVLEAMAAGKPVAVSKVEGIDELLGEAVDEQSCPPQQPQALIELIDRLWNDPHRAEKIGLQNHQRALDHYDLGAMTEAYHRLYRRLVNAHEGGQQ